MFFSLQSSKPLFSFSQQSLDQVFGSFANLFPNKILKLNISFLNILNSVTKILCFERRFTCYHLVESDSSSPNIYFLVISSPWEHFWSSVVQCTSYCKHFLLVAPIVYIPRNSKINNFDFLVLSIIENIIRFYISVTDPLRVDIVQSVQKLMSYLFYFLLTQICKR